MRGRRRGAWWGPRRGRMPRRGWMPRAFSGGRKAALLRQHLVRYEERGRMKPHREADGRRAVELFYSSAPMGPSAPPHAHCYHAKTQHAARHLPNGPPRGKYASAGLAPRAFSGGRKAAPPKATALATGCPRERLRKCPTALCAIWQTVNADVLPWIGRSIPWKFRSMGTFRPKNGPEFCHIAAKMVFLGFRAEVSRRDVLHCQAFPIFAYLCARVDVVENNRFSVLKTGALAAFRGGGAAVTGRAVAAWRMLAGHEKAPHPWRVRGV